MFIFVCFLFFIYSNQYILSKITRKIKYETSFFRAGTGKLKDFEYNHSKIIQNNMQFSIDNSVFEKYPGLEIGLITIKKLDNSKRVSALESLLRGISAQRRRELIENIENIQLHTDNWEKIYEENKAKENNLSPSLPTLLRILKEEKDIPNLNPILDMGNYFALKYLVPVSMKDLDWLCGDLKLMFTSGGEPFRKLGTIDVEIADAGEIAYMDEGGIINRYWNYVECDRTKVTKKSTDVGIFIENIGTKKSEDFRKILDEIYAAIGKYIGGELEMAVLTKDNFIVNLGVQGRKSADDSKISAQEKAYYLTQQKKLREKIEKQNEVKEVTEPVKQPQKSVQKNTGPETFNIQDNETYKSKIKLLLEQAIIKTFPDPINTNIEVTESENLEHGDYSCSIAMKLAKILSKAPVEIANHLSENISKENFIEKIEVLPPGFINFFLSKEALNKEIDLIISDPKIYGKSQVGEGKTMLVEYSSPNIAKPLGAQHLITTILGQSLYNIYKWLGYNTISLNYVGDFGTQFGKLIYAYKKWGNKKKVEENPIPELLSLYVKFHEEAEKNPKLDDDARHEFKIFEDGDEENRKLWKWFVEESLKDIQKTYETLGGIHFDFYQGESFFEDKMEEILLEGKQKGIFVEGEEGAFVIKYDDPSIPPYLIQKKDAATLYSTRDFAALKYRINQWHPLKILYVVDTAQKLHFTQLFEGAKRFPWYHGEGVHVSFGRMSMKDKKMSTRKGNIILLDEVLAEANKRALKVATAKSKDKTKKEEIAKKVGVSAVKYSILCQNRSTDIVFDWDKMLSVDGNSAAYLQYTYARAFSILNKSRDPETDDTEKKIRKSNPEKEEQKTLDLIRLFPRFKESIFMAAEEYKPNILCNYLYSLCQEFNSFYNAVSVLNAEKEEDKAKRLKIIEAVVAILKNGLTLLGIETPEEM